MFSQLDSLWYSLLSRITIDDSSVQENLAWKIERCASYLSQSERYEAIAPLYRIIVPTLEIKENFNVSGGVLS